MDKHNIGKEIGRIKVLVNQNSRKAPKHGHFVTIILGVYSTYSYYDQELALDI